MELLAQNPEFLCHASTTLGAFARIYLLQESMRKGRFLSLTLLAGIGDLSCAKKPQTKPCSAVLEKPCQMEKAVHCALVFVFI